METQLEASVIGLGMMGSTLARLLLAAGYRVTVWNRSRAKAQALIDAGAHWAETAAQAVTASPVVVVCVHNHAASFAILDTAEARAAFEGRLLVQLTTNSPPEARETEAWAKRLGAQYLDGAIQAAPEQMGLPHTPILVSGARAAYERGEPVLKVFGGGISYFGEAAGAAATADLATLSYVYGAIAGFLHGARVIESEGMDVAEYGAVVEGIAPSFGSFFKHEGEVIRSGDFRITQSPMSISLEAVERIAQHARDTRLDTSFTEFAARLFARARDAGLANEELAALVKVLRQPV